MLDTRLHAGQCKPSAQSGDSCHWPVAMLEGKLATVALPVSPPPPAAAPAESDFRQLGSVTLPGHTWSLATSRYAMNTSADLLKELRIDRKAPPPAPPARSRLGLWIGLGIALLALLAAGSLGVATFAAALVLLRRIGLRGRGDRGSGIPDQAG